MYEFYDISMTIPRYSSHFDGILSTQTDLVLIYIRFQIEVRCTEFRNRVRSVAKRLNGNPFPATMEIRGFRRKRENCSRKAYMWYYFLPSILSPARYTAQNETGDIFGGRNYFSVRYPTVHKFPKRCVLAKAESMFKHVLVILKQQLLKVSELSTFYSNENN